MVVTSMVVPTPELGVARAGRTARVAPWLRKLGQPPASIKGQRAWRQATDRILQYRERYGITDPDHALGLEPCQADLEQRRHHRATHQVIQRLQDRHREQWLGRRERAHTDQPRQAHPNRPGASNSGQRA
jgi:hypothetical protein